VGSRPLRDCYVCGGQGYIVTDDDADAANNYDCKYCEGTGKIPFDPCMHKDGWRWSKFYTYRTCVRCGHTQYPNDEGNFEGEGPTT
jgi:DnaJ-class molecular chaperone